VRKGPEQDFLIIFQDRRFAENCWTHGIETLVKAADLEMARGLDMSGNPALALNWQHANDRAEKARYERTTTVENRRPHEAATDRVNGAPPWVKTHL